MRKILSEFFPLCKANQELAPCACFQLRFLGLLTCAVALIASGCASMNDAMTPSAHIQKDEFDGSTIITQAPVSAAGSLSDAWNTMGFDWSSKTPDTVYVTIGVQGVSNISGVKFNADGAIIETAKPASVGTDYANATIGMAMNGIGDKTTSTRRFAMPLSDFKTIATANDVRMRVEMINTYNVSKFGKANKNAIVNTKFGPFLKKIEAAK